MVCAPFLRSALRGVCLLGIVAPVLRAASPPMITDDPGTPPVGHWEINLGVSTEKRAGLRASELPLIDINYGLTDRIQLKYEVPYLSEREAGEPTLKAWGNSEAGVKWRFRDGGEKGASVSVYPQVEFNTPGSHADQDDLVEHGTAFKLPFQFQREIAGCTLTAQAGREFRSGAGTWFGSASLGWQVNEHTEIAVELAAEANVGLHRSILITDLGATVDLGEHSSLMFSVGRELHNHEEERASLVAYAGIQWRL